MRAVSEPGPSRPGTGQQHGDIHLSSYSDGSCFPMPYGVTTSNYNRVCSRRMQPQHNAPTGGCNGLKPVKQERGAL